MGSCGTSSAFPVPSSKRQVGFEFRKTVVKCGRPVRTQLFSTQTWSLAAQGGEQAIGILAADDGVGFGHSRGIDVADKHDLCIERAAADKACELSVAGHGGVDDETGEPGVLGNVFAGFFVAVGDHEFEAAGLQDQRSVAGDSHTDRFDQQTRGSRHLNRALEKKPAPDGGMSIAEDDMYSSEFYAPKYAMTSLVI